MSLNKTALISTLKQNAIDAYDGEMSQAQLDALDVKIQADADAIDAFVKSGTVTVTVASAIPVQVAPATGTGATTATGTGTGSIS